MKLLDTSASNTKVRKSQKESGLRIASLSLYPNDLICSGAALALCMKPCLKDAGFGIFPNVKDGSVLEWKYELMSENIFSLGTWYFQYSIPVVHSSYKVSIPSYFNYQSRLIGFDKPSDKVVDYGSDVIYFGTIKSSIDTRSIKIIYKDVEALKAELSDPRFADSWWQDQINMMLELGKKAEQQSLAKYGLDFVTETYLPEKLAELGLA